MIAEVERKGPWDGRIVTEVVPLTRFHPAEAYHQEYFRRNPEPMYCQAVVAPKVAKLRRAYASLLR